MESLSGCLTNPESIVKKVLTSQVPKGVLMDSTDVSPTIPFQESHLLRNLCPEAMGTKVPEEAVFPLWMGAHSDSFSFADT